MSRVPQSDDIVKDGPEETKPEERVHPSPRKGLVQRVIPSSGEDRRRVNIILLGAVIPLLLVGVALANIFIPSVTASPDIMQERAGQTVQATQRVLEQRLETMVSIASDPIIGSADSQREAAQQRLHDYLAVFTQFEGLAILDQNGELFTSAGTLPPGPQVWANELPYQSSGSAEIVPYSPPREFSGAASRVSAGLDHNAAGANHLLFIASTKDIAKNIDEGTKATRGPLRTAVGFTSADSVLESATSLMYGKARSVGAPDRLVRELAYTLETPDAQPQIRLVSLTAPEFALPGSSMAGGFIEPTSPGGTATIYRRMSAPNGISLPWYLLLRVPNSTNDINPLVGNLSLTMATLAVLLTLVACWAILRSALSSQPQPSMALAETPHSQPDPVPAAPDTGRDEISRRLVAVQESVRREMADYIHGHVQSKLLALSMSLGMCQQVLEKSPDEAQEMLVHIQSELHKVYDEDLRQVSQELYPTIVKMGLIPSVRSLVSRFDHALEIELDIDPALKSLDLAGEAGVPEKQRLGMYRVAEEALTNTLKHSRASCVQVTLAREGTNQLALSIADNGDGFDPSRVASNQGLVMIADYAAAIGGRTEIVSALGRGTTIKVIIELD